MRASFASASPMTSGSTPSELRLTLCQVAAVADVETNLRKAESAFEEAQTQQSDLIIFPENIFFRGSQDEVRTVGLSRDEFVARLGGYSRQSEVCAVWGGTPVRRAGNFYNTALIISASGELIAEYAKAHLFEYHGSDQQLDETTLYDRGQSPLAFELKDWRIGMTICYDLRFPELYRVFAGAHLILCTAEFTHTTGKAHWEVLLRARAIENQCYVAGVNQCGINPSLSVKAYGHSMVIDPWGEILTVAEESETCLHCVIQKNRIHDVRSRIPALQSIAHRIEW